MKAVLLVLVSLASASAFADKVSLDCTSNTDSDQKVTALADANSIQLFAYNVNVDAASTAPFDRIVAKADANLTTSALVTYTTGGAFATSVALDAGLLLGNDGQLVVSQDGTIQEYTYSCIAR